MKILIIVPSLRNGGAERVAANLSKSFEQRGYDVLVVTFSKGSLDYPVTNHLELGIEASRNELKKLINVLLRSFNIRRVKKVFRPDVSISFMFGANLVNAITKQKLELTIASVRGTTKSEDGVSFSKLLNSLVYNFSDYIVPVSKGISYEILEKYKIESKRIRVVYNFVDVASDVPIKKCPKNTINLITLGRLTDIKAQWHLIHTVNILKNNYPSVVLNILGQGELIESYQSLISELKLEQHVSLLGYQHDIENYLNSSDIFCLSSRNEGLPNVILEAMNLGLPIISTDIPHGPKEILNPNENSLYENDDAIVEDKYGFLVDYGNNPNTNDFGYRDEYIVNQFVEKITLLIENKSLYEHYSKQSLRRVRDFSEETIISQWIELFEEGMKHS